MVALFSQVRSNNRRIVLSLIVFISFVWANFLWADHMRWGGTLYLNGAGGSKRGAADASEYVLDNPRDRMEALLRKSPRKEVRAFVIFDGYYPAETVLALPCDRVYTLYVTAPDIRFRYAYTLSSPAGNIEEALAAFIEAVQKSVDPYGKGEYLHMFSDGNSTPKDVLDAYTNGTLYIKSVSVEDTAQNLQSSIHRISPNQSTYIGSQTPGLFLDTIRSSRPISRTRPLPTETMCGARADIFTDRWAVLPTFNSNIRTSGQCPEVLIFEEANFIV